MDTWQILLIALAPIILAPFINAIRRKFRRKPPIKVLSRCPHCQTIIGLQNVRNYICEPCGKTVAFYNINTKELLPETKSYSCEICGGEILENILTCEHCGNHQGLTKEEREMFNL